MRMILVLLLIILASSLAACGPQAGSPASPGPAAVDRAATPASPDLAKPAWQTSWEKSLAVARNEGKIVLYGELGPGLRTALTQAIKDSFGIELEVVTAPTREIIQRLITERERNINLADAILLGTDFTDIKAKGIIGPVEPLLIRPEVKDSSFWPGGSLPFLDKDHLTLALTGAYWSYILVNSDTVAEGDLKSYKDLAHPRWRSKLVMFDPTGSGAAVWWVMFVLNRALPSEEGRALLEQVARQDLTVINDKRLQVEWVARGKYAIAIGPNMQTVTEFKKAGAPIAWRRMTEGGLVHPSSSVLSVPTNRPHPNAAAVFVNWLLTGEGQRIFSQAFGQPPNRLGVNTEGIDPFTVPVPGEKFYLIDEDFIVTTQTRGRLIGKEIFGHLIK